MEEVLIVKRLERVDRELHSVIDELRFGKQRTLSLSELNKYMEKDRISDVDSTKLIREMRDREYDLSLPMTKGCMKLPSKSELRLSS